MLNTWPNIAVLPSISRFPADEDVMNVMHRFRPGFIAKNEIPSYFEPYAFKHTCLLQSDLAEDVDALTLEDENLDSSLLQHRQRTQEAQKTATMKGPRKLTIVIKVGTYEDVER